jgi:hypothetical protein
MFEVRGVPRTGAPVIDGSSIGSTRRGYHPKTLKLDGNLARWSASVCLTCAVASVEWYCSVECRIIGETQLDLAFPDDRARMGEFTSPRPGVLRQGDFGDEEKP